ncbi:amino acid/amide ABC transporter substrate-binding protein, HAAT family [Thalassovita litoralis]|jgi:branched-chain amino acid transport system substrate-binding protein|uniref:Amino acid/amide ABC transporter substrate-binding protein, HAAT family n=1 Tax=Thalassovita litoralis TaxID=1010611 RepID=A0A521BME0_9RHOB|nr:ABC transporter substrate-binding protein [Thalassovita litoralis]SMO48262.1 amino acid/amide ABC transporter substrate-binding protein, HAAT family [Thalassovita litoralis]
MKTTKQNGLSRRDFMVAAGAAGVTTLASPTVLRAAGSPIKIGMPTILSGRVAILGETASVGAKMAVDAFNAAGGIDGRMVELVIRDSKGKPDEAAKVTRDLLSSDGCAFILNGEASGGTFAVHEVVRDTKTYCMHTISETSSLTADPANRAPWVFRSARQGIHDAISGGLYAANLAKAGATRWATCSPDYAYGRSTTSEFMEFLAVFAPEVKLVGETWPKIFQPDYTENITNLLNVAPDALYSCLWGGDLVAFFDQASLYGLFDQFQTVAVNMGDVPVLEAIKNLPGGIHSGNRYHKDIPDVEANENWNTEFRKSGQLPTNWAWQTYTGAQFVLNALKDTGGDTDYQKLADATRGRTIDSPFGVNGTVTMREADNTLVDYAIGYGQTVPQPPYLTGFEPTAWDVIVDYETDWKKRNSFL